MTVGDLIQAGAARLEKAQIQCAQPLLHMKQLVARALEWEMTALYLKWNESLSREHLDIVEGWLKRRLQGEPFQYIAGEEWFWDSRFSVGPGVLIPRRETEHLVQAMLERLPQTAMMIAELGPGSGNIGISACLERPLWNWEAFEIHDAVLPYLRRNAETLLTEKRHSFHIHQQDFFSGVSSFPPFDAIVSNPPYVTTEEMSRLPLEVRHEPERALCGGDDGLKVIRQMVGACDASLIPGGWLFCEIGYEQELAVKALMEPVKWSVVEVLKDYANLPRVLTAKKG